MESLHLTSLFLLCALCPGSLGTKVPLGSASYTGYHMILNVDRQRLQDKLDKISDERDDSLRLYVPPPPQCSDDGDCEGVHPIQIQWGVIDPIGEDVTASGFGIPHDEFMVNIPFLSTEPEGEGRVTLMLETFTSTKDAALVYNVAMQHDRKVADTLSVQEDDNTVRIDFKHDNLRLSAVGERPSGCGTPNEFIAQLSVRDYFLENVLSMEAPDFSICDGELRGVDLEYCRAWRGYGDQIRAAGADVCQVWTPADVGLCDITFEIEGISEEFLAHYALDEDDLEVAGAFFIDPERSVFDYAIEFPCVG